MGLEVVRPLQESHQETLEKHDLLATVTGQTYYERHHPSLHRFPTKKGPIMLRRISTLAVLLLLSLAGLP